MQIIVRMVERRKENPLESGHLVSYDVDALVEFVKGERQFRVVDRVTILGPGKTIGASGFRVGRAP